MTDERNESEEKAAYAALLLKERDPFKAALQLFPDNTNRALWVANHWPNDDEVKAEQTRLSNEEGDSFLLSKREFLQDIEQRMRGTVYPNGAVIPPTPEEYAKLAKLYADVRGFIEKPQTNVNVNNIMQRVVEVPVFQSESEWEAAAAKQQRELLNNARTRH
uniref:Terminase small subunit n=1 Tax=Stenotrophomonas phage vB_SmaS_QH3 TaxID=3229738 RepID=A0AAU7YTF4_9CAUD